jgi:hypothetical protein
MNRKGLAVGIRPGDHHPVRQPVQGKPMSALGAPIEALTMENAIDLGRWQRQRLVRCRGPCRHEGDRIPAPTFEAGPVPGSEGGNLIEEKQLGVPVAPDRSEAVVK